MTMTTQNPARHHTTFQAQVWNGNCWVSGGGSWRRSDADALAVQIAAERGAPVQVVEERIEIDGYDALGDAPEAEDYEG